MKKTLGILLFLWVLNAGAQIYVENMDQMILTGSLRTDGNLYLPVRWAKVELKGMNKVVYADGTGYFVMDGKGLIITSNSGDMVVVVSADGYETTEFIVEPGRMELGVLFVKQNFKDIEPITVNDLMPDKPEIDNQMAGKIGAGALFWNNDPLAKSVNYHLGMHGYKMRGYDRRNTEVYLNGASFNDPETGYAFAGLLNRFINITGKNSGSSRIVDNALYDAPIGGYSSIETSPLLTTARAKVSYSFSNALYTHSVEASYSTGKMASGWALALLLSGRMGDGFVPGSNYDGLSYMFSAGKEIDDYHKFSFFIAGAPAKRGGLNYSTQTIYEQTGNNYFNSAAGNYRGSTRNSKQNEAHQPILGFSHEWEGEISSLKTSLLATTGTRHESELMWNGATSDGVHDPFTSPQALPWDSIYAENSRRQSSKYILGTNSSNRTMISLNSVYDLFHWGPLETTAGIEAKLFLGRYYGKVDDLLGGSHWLNVDKFLTSPIDPDFYQFDLNLPNRQIAKDGRFGHDYSVRHQSYKLWNIWRYYLGSFKFSLGASAAYLAHGYESNLKNGKAPNESGVKAPDKKFFNWSGKAGAAYKFDAQSNVEINAMYAVRAPLFTDAFLLPRISGELLPNLSNEKIIAGELNYFAAGKRLDLRASGYFTLLIDQSMTRNYYNETFVSHIAMGISGLNTMHAGGELSAKYSVNKTLKIDFAAAYGFYRYTSDPAILLRQENINETLIADTARMNGLFVGNAPQLAVSAGLIYHSPWNFWAGLNLNYSGMNYADENPFTLLYNNPVEGYSAQTQLAAAFTLNLRGGYSLVLGKKRSRALSLNVNINNLLDQHGVLGAYRPFGLENNDMRYAYIYGRTMFMMLRFWF
ncbi:MAG: hypothetical protein LBD59_05665 [Prevotellaceae bacterium]|nr:hypothetical protein [Prevotellaceae bacterium]